jgi:hypothetical protein
MRIPSSSHFLFLLLQLLLLLTNMVSVLTSAQQSSRHQPYSTLTVQTFKNSVTCNSPATPTTFIDTDNYITETCLSGNGKNSLYAFCNNTVATIQTYLTTDECAGTFIESTFSVDACIVFDNAFSMRLRCSAGNLVTVFVVVVLVNLVLVVC